jgi:hypothetical protein
MPHLTETEPLATDEYTAECLRLVDSAIETLREQVRRLLEYRKEASDE